MDDSSLDDLFFDTSRLSAKVKNKINKTKKMSKDIASEAVDNANY